MTATLAFLWACGNPEQPTVDQFFRAAQTKDHSTLASMSIVASPVEAESWKVIEVSSRSTEPFALPELLERFEVAKKERDANTEQRKKYASDHAAALEQIIPKLRDDPEYQFKGKLAEIQAEWTRLLDERGEKERALQEVKQVVNRETSLATNSVVRQLSVEKLRGNIAVTEMLVNLKPRDSGELPFKVTLRKYNLSEPESDRIEHARWVIAAIEGVTPEARAAASAPAKASKPASASAAAAESSKAGDKPDAPESEPSAGKKPGYVPQELRGVARVQILTPETKVEGDEAVTAIRARNVSKDFLLGFTVTEHWYDKQGTAVATGSRTHRERFMPGAVVEMQLRTRKSPAFYQNQFEFSHANGQVQATTVGSFPKQE